MLLKSYLLLKIIKFSDWFKGAEALKHATSMGGISLHCYNRCCQQRGFHGGSHETQALSLSLLQHHSISSVFPNYLHFSR